MSSDHNGERLADPLRSATRTVMEAIERSSGAVRLLRVTAAPDGIEFFVGGDHGSCAAVCALVPPSVPIFVREQAEPPATDELGPADFAFIDYLVERALASWTRRR